MIGIINKSLLLHLVCVYIIYIKWCTAKQPHWIYRSWSIIIFIVNLVFWRSTKVYIKYSCLLDTRIYAQASKVSVLLYCWEAELSPGISAEAGFLCDWATVTGEVTSSVIENEISFTGTDTGNELWWTVFNTLRTGDADLRFYITTMQDEWRKSSFLTRASFPCTVHLIMQYIEPVSEWSCWRMFIETWPHSELTFRHRASSI